MPYSSKETENLRIIRDALTQTKNDHAQFFPRVFSPDVVYQIAGSGPVARTYHGMEDLAENAERDLFTRLKTPLSIEIVNLYADGDTVLAWVRSTAEALDGQPYGNEYMFLMTMKEGVVVSGIEWLNLLAYYDLVDRVSI